MTEKSCMVYHTTAKSNYESIVREGLKPICDKSKKLIPWCKDALYFSTNLDKATEFAINNIEENFIVLEVPLSKLFKNCSYLQEEDNNVLAYSGVDTYNYKRNCIIKNTDMKLAFDKEAWQSEYDEKMKKNNR